MACIDSFRSRWLYMVLESEGVDVELRGVASAAVGNQRQKALIYCSWKGGRV